MRELFKCETPYLSMPKISPYREEIVLLLKQSTSINKISARLNVAKSTIYHHYKKLFGRKIKQPEFIVGSNPEVEGEIVGIFAGDGSQYFDKKAYHYQVNVHFGLKNRRYAEYVKSLFERFFDKHFNLKNEFKHGTLRLQTNSKIIFHFFKNYLNYNCKIKHSTVELKSKKNKRLFYIGFIRGLFDTDGTVSYYPAQKRKIVLLTTTSQTLAKQVKQILEKFKVCCTLHAYDRRHRNEKTIYVVRVLSKSIDTFLNIFNPFKRKEMDGRMAKRHRARLACERLRDVSAFALARKFESRSVHSLFS